eukprot:266253-Chlamydomonas_euryale.AAC.1
MGNEKWGAQGTWEMSNGGHKAHGKREMGDTRHMGNEQWGTQGTWEMSNGGHKAHGKRQSWRKRDRQS